MKAFVFYDFAAFVPVPGLRGLWFKVHPCVALVDCPSCKSKRGTPCIGKCAFLTAHHVVRLRAYRRKR